MQSWLEDNFWFLIIGLSIFGLAFAYLGWRTRQRYYAIAAGTAVILMGLVWLLPLVLPRLFGESDSQQIRRKIREMADAVKVADLDRIFSHISRDFNYRGHGRADFRQRSAEVLRSRQVEAVIVWDFEDLEIARKDRTAKVRFLVKPRGPWQGSEAGYPCEADFVLDSDGQWRMKGFQIFNPFVESDQPIPVPGF